MSAPATVEGLREAFLSYFEARGHRRIPSSSLVPHGDPTLLFTTAGMVQLRPYFMGLEEPPARRLISIQKCFRTTDVEDVGDESHLTFFEMLGNFSVGDYFKREAVEWAWEFMTEHLEIPPGRLWATVYTDDDEAFALWRGRGIPAERILRYSAEQGNYWYSGEVGPCGPCSELHYDWGESEGCAACARAECHPDVGCGRFLEVWNLVFMTYFQDEDGAKTPLPAQNIDTGAGLERVAAVLAGVRTVYETDELRGLLGEAERLTGRRYEPAGDPEGARALRAIAEHARAAAFLVADGVLPGNEGRGYVLRRMIRRAIYFGHTIAPGVELFEPLVARAIETARAAYPDLAGQASVIRRTAQAEEARFRATLTRGLELLGQLIERAPAGEGAGVLPGREMFVLYDTHGLPPELTREVASERGLRVDEEGFEREMEAQRERSRAADAGAAAVTDSEQRYAALGLQSRFTGYDGTRGRGVVIGLQAERGEGASPAARERLGAGESGEVVLDATSFYPEGGGQVGDRGEIAVAGPGGAAARFRVDDTRRLAEAIVHRGEVVEGEISLGDEARTSVSDAWRSGCQRNHTATHLLHAALRAVLGPQVRQGGSLVAPDRLRFDYTLPEAPDPGALRTVQRMVNERVRNNIESQVFELPYDEAIDRGAIAFFEDRYATDVRVVEYCDPHVHDPRHRDGCWSSELCGGTHLPSTGRIGSFVIVSEASIGSGLRRIEALTGPEAERYLEERVDVVADLMRHFRSRPDELGARVEALEEQLAAERRRARELARSESAGAASRLAADAEDHGGARLAVARVEVESQEALRGLAEAVRGQLGEIGLVALAAEAAGRPIFVAAATEGAVARGLRADELVRVAAARAGGGGGGRPQMAQAGGRDPSAIGPALEAAADWARARLRDEG